MIEFDNNKIVAIRFLSLMIKKVYAGTKLIWSYITSCFGSGFWTDNSDWIDSDFWKD